jgi:cell wall-associated NlpC family hydrolase
MTPADVIAEARSYLGVPFRHQGRDHRGIDCVGVPIAVGRTLGLWPQDWDTATYGRIPTGELIARVAAKCRQIPTPVPGSLIVIAWTKLAAHTAICTGETMIHAYESVGRVVEHGYRGRWIRMTHSAWALPGVSYE